MRLICLLIILGLITNVRAEEDDYSTEEFLTDLAIASSIELCDQFYYCRMTVSFIIFTGIMSFISFLLYEWICTLKITWKKIAKKILTFALGIYMVQYFKHIYNESN